MSTTNIQSGERLTFNKIFTEKNYRIEIPIIQRDYAQGRDSSKDVRDLFLKALYTHLEENIPNRDLDFVYGSLVNDGTLKFIPLDGQQRLTTLFLLHWYLANLSGNHESFVSVMLDQNGKSKFSYETRSSAQEFCASLLKFKPNFYDLLSPDKDQSNSLSKTIRNEGWYYLSWKYDPTVKSMLTMLDSIHSIFFEYPDYYTRLINNDKPIITFLFLNLKDFKLTDDLYIKMNSRGKPLTSFENFKAKFEQYLGKIDGQDNYTLDFSGKLKEVSLREYFSHKIDTEWANLFWNYKSLVQAKNEDNSDNTFDDELMNYFRVNLANLWAERCIGDNYMALEYLIGTQVAKKNKDYSDKFTFNRFEELGAFSKNNVKFLIESFDALVNGTEKIKKHLDDVFFFNENRIFERVLKAELTLPQRVQFYAYINYIISQKEDRQGLFQWMRVVHNLTENTPIDSAEDVSKAIKSLEKLLMHSSNIIDKFNDNSLKVDFFYGPQVIEEKIKSCLIVKSNEWQNLIINSEKHQYFKGQIAFILEFSGILEYYLANSNCNWSSEDNETFFENAISYSQKSQALFAYVLEGKNNYLWERAVLSKGDYLVPASRNRKNFLSNNRYHRDYSWKRLLRIPTFTNEEEFEQWRLRRSYIKEVFDDTRFNKDDIENSLKSILKDIISGWRKNIVENPKLIDYCQQGFMRFESSSSILLYKESQQNHRHREMYTYNLFDKWMTNSTDFLPFQGLEHWEVRSGDEFSCIYLSNYVFERKSFAIDVYFDARSKDFTIKFYKSKGNIEENDYPEKLLNLIKAQNLGWSTEYKGYWTARKTEKEVIDFLKPLCISLQTL